VKITVSFHFDSLCLSDGGDRGGKVDYLLQITDGTY